MVIRFTPCPSCARHVKVGDGACPFCGAITPRAAVAAIPRGRLSRAALLAAGAAGALAMADCGSSGSTVAPYGSPPRPPDAGMSMDDGGETPDASATVVFYGAASPPFLDASESNDRDATGPSDAATPDAAEASTSDSGVGDEGGHMVQPLYGAVAPAYGATPH